MYLWFKEVEEHVPLLYLYCFISNFNIVMQSVTGNMADDDMAFMRSDGDSVLKCEHNIRYKYINIVHE
jgi:hypothetical protein